MNRADIAIRFGVSNNQVSRDLTRYQAIAPGNLVYDKSAKCYRPTDAFRPRFFAPDVDGFLAQLRLVADRAVAIEDTWVEAPPSFDLAVTPAQAVAVEMLRAILVAIRTGRALEVHYQSLTRPEPLWRWIEPHALGCDGVRWHARAFCRRSVRFRDFGLGRLLATGTTDAAAAAPDADADWHGRVELELAPHPRLAPAQRAVVARDYGMVGERLRLSVRRALLGYTLRRLRLDLDPDGLPERERVIVLANRTERCWPNGRRWRRPSPARPCRCLDDPMSLELWFAFVVASSILLAIPGPTILLVVSYALSQGRRSVAATVTGVGLGDFTAMTASLIGLGALLATSAALFIALKWLGAAYLIWLGVGLWRAPIAAADGATSEGASAARLGAGRMFRDAYLVTALNPKSITFFIAFLPQFLDPAAPVLGQLVVMEATFLVLAIANAAGFALLAASARRAIARPALRRWVNRIGGGALIGAGLLTASLRRTA